MGGFGICGIPENAILAIKEKGTQNLSVASNTCGKDILKLFDHKCPI